MEDSPARPRSRCATYQTVRKALLLLLVVPLTLFPKRALAEDLNGTWQASPLRVSWAVGDWGKACGPRPSGGGESGGTVQITQTGSMGFSLQGLGRNYSSGQCWEQMPGLSPRGKTLSPTTIQTTCRMPGGDPRQAKVVTSWYPRGDKIYFDETGQYQFVVSGSNCTASVRRTRVLTRMVSAPEADPLAARTEMEGKKDDHDASSNKTPDRPPAPARASRCQKPGKPVRAEVTPRSKLMRPGESFHFEALARDAVGCRVPIPAQWELTGGKGVELSQEGVLDVAKDAAPGHVTLVARIGDQKVEVGARIVAQDEYEQLIAGGKYGALGESLDAATVELSSTHVEFEKTTQDPPEKRRPLVWGAFAALIALFFGLFVYLLKRRRERRADTFALDSAQNGSDETSENRPSHEELAQTQAVGSPAVHATKPPRLCPVCGRRYEEETAFCVDDGARLMRAN